MHMTTYSPGIVQFPSWRYVCRVCETFRVNTLCAAASVSLLGYFSYTDIITPMI